MVEIPIARNDLGESGQKGGGGVNGVPTSNRTQLHQVKTAGLHLCSEVVHDIRSSELTALRYGALSPDPPRAVENELLGRLYAHVDGRP